MIENRKLTDEETQELVDKAPEVRVLVSDMINAIRPLVSFLRRHGGDQAVAKAALKTVEEIFAAAAKEGGAEDVGTLKAFFLALILDRLEGKTKGEVEDGVEGKQS
ncbi:hypothetical protein E1091_07460 [Micromonospora fluostatini]|uniref:Uncharacterized protein n=1 Tax=Micromonospora fluostatini TaxID=1629071 RepID=A0ABY2DI99_9ACTN|nr:hypothetical protein E1091_07460 [Micromonospora fluostatini]